MRKHYLDNIRWITVFLVLIYHVFYIFNAEGVWGGVGGFTPTQYQDVFLYFVYPWFMVLLFVVSGMSTRFALEKKTDRQFIKDRTVKLLIPSTLGLVVFQWIVGWLNITVGGGMADIPPFLRYPIIVLTGIGPLWFIQVLWLFSLLIILIRRLDKNGRLCELGGKCGIPVLLALFIPVWGASQILNAPVITTYRFGIYFLTFLLGYCVFSHDEIMEKIEKIHVPMLIAAVALGIAYVWYFFGQDYTGSACLQHIFTSVYLWAAVLAILGCGKAWLNKTSPFMSYMAKSSFGVYIVHYGIVLASCYLLKTYTALPPALIYALCIISVCVLSPALYEIFRRIPLIRYFVLGIKKPAAIEKPAGK